MSEKFEGFHPPDEGPRTPVPNAFFDACLTKMTPVQAVLLFAIFRQTYGWHKTSDAISLSQLCDKTALSRRAIIDAIKQLEKKGFISVSRSSNTPSGNLTNVYSIPIFTPEDALDPQQAQQMGSAVDDLFEDRK